MRAWVGEVEAGGLRIAYRRAGAGPPLVLLHGGLADSRVWRDQLDDADERAPLAVAGALHAAIPGSELVVMPGLGHECYLESPQAFNGEVRRFLRTVA